MKHRRLEIKVGIPDGYILVGARTSDDNDVIIVVEPHPREIRQIGFVPEPMDEDEEGIEEDG